MREHDNPNCLRTDDSDEDVTRRRLSGKAALLLEAASCPEKKGFYLWIADSGERRLVFARRPLPATQSYGTFFFIGATMDDLIVFAEDRGYRPLLERLSAKLDVGVGS